MFLCKNTNTALYFSSVNEISQTIWEQLKCTSNVYFNPKYLISLEKNNPHVSFVYIILVNQEKKAIAFASIQIVNFELKDIQKSLSKNFQSLKNISKSIGLTPKLKTTKLLICGNAFVSGEHGIFIAPHQNKQKVIKQLANAIAHFSKINKTLAKDISIYLLKDFAEESLNITDELHDLNYYSFHVEPNMVLQLDENWHSFEDYLASMKTKFRVKAKRALNLSSAMHIEEPSQEKIDKILPEIGELYQKVSAKADFNLGHFNPETYRSLKENFGENYIFKTYWYEGSIVGFMSGIINLDCLDAHFVGIAYSLNKTLAIYQKMLYDYVEIGINNNVKQINFGRTASEIKSSIGATPQELTCYIRHKKSITNQFIRPFLNYIEPKPFVQKKPFKVKV